MAKSAPLFSKTIAAEFHYEAGLCTYSFTPARGFLGHIVGVLDGERPRHRHISVENGGIVLRPGSQKYWPVVKEVCNAVPGIQWIDLGSRGLGIGPSAS